MSNTILAKGIPSTVTESKLHEFFSFCGKIDTITKSGSDSYEVKFVYPSAISTALLLNGAELEGSTISVTETGATASREVGATDATSTTTASTTTTAPEPTHDENDDIPQEHKPKSAILAEYLSHGYLLGDNVINKAVEFDQQRGISDKFKGFLGKLDDKYHITDKNEQLLSDEKVQTTLTSTKRNWNTYLDKFKNDKYGSKVHEFYSKAVNDAKEVHEEAKRLAELKKQEASPSTTTPTSAAAPSDSTTSAPGAGIEAHGQTGIKPDSTTAQLAANVPFEKN